MDYSIDASKHFAFVSIGEADLAKHTNMEITTDPTVPFTQPAKCHREDITFIEGDENHAPLIGTVLVDSSQTFYTACIIFQGNDPRAADVLTQGLWKEKIDQFPMRHEIPEDFTIAEPYSPIYTYVDTGADSTERRTLFTIMQPEELAQGPINKLPLAVALATYNRKIPLVFIDTESSVTFDTEETLENARITFTNAAIKEAALSKSAPIRYFSSLLAHTQFGTAAPDGQFANWEIEASVGKATFTMKP